MHGHPKKVREKSRECHNHKPQPFPDIKRKQTNQTSANRTNVRKALRLALSEEQKITQGTKKVREKSRECHNHNPQPFPDIKRKRKQTKPTSANRTNVRKALRLALSSQAR